VAARTPRKDSKAAGGRSLINYEKLLDLSTDAIFVRDLDGRIAYWNKGAERIYGYSRNEAMGQVSHELLQTVFPRRREEIEANVQTEGQWKGDLDQRRKDGTRIVVESHWTLSGDLNGQSEILQINADVTERRDAERVRATSEAHFRALIESAPDPIVIVDLQGRIALVNRQVQEVFGYLPGELLGRPVEQLMPERFRRGHVKDRERYTRAPRTRPMGSGLELLGVRQNGEEFPVEISLSPLGEGEEMQVTAVIRDVSDRKRHEEALRRLHMLQLAETEHLATLGEIAAGMAHEIRNPLGGISAALEILAPGTVPEENREVIAEMQRQVVRIRRVVEELLHYARPQPLQLAAGDLNQTLELVVQFVRRQAHARAVEIGFEPGPLPPVVHDPEQIHRLAVNLGLNAIQAVSDGGRVVVATWHDPVRAVAGIEVRDNGTGIAAADLDKVFRPFFSTKGGQGTGLGLSLCRRIAELHGGTLTVVSTPGNGSTFTATLPADSRTPQAQTPGSHHGR